MTNSSPWLLRWPIEIDGLPNLKMVIFHGELLNNQIATSGHGILFFSKHKVEPLHFVEQVAWTEPKRNIQSQICSGCRFQDKLFSVRPQTALHVSWFFRNIPYLSIFSYTFLIFLHISQQNTWGWVKTLVPSEPKIAGKWMFIPLKMYL